MIAQHAASRGSCPARGDQRAVSAAKQTRQRRGQLRKAEAESGSLGRAGRYPLAREQHLRHLAKQQPQREFRDREHRGSPESVSQLTSELRVGYGVRGHAI